MSSYMCSYIHKKNIDFIYLPVNSPMKIRLWNTEMFKHLNRSLICWLDGDIIEGDVFVGRTSFLFFCLSTSLILLLMCLFDDWG